MKLASTRLVTNDVRALARFYAAITGFRPVGIENYVELETANPTNQKYEIQQSHLLDHPRPH
jgi:hypothetical protein